MPIKLPQELQTRRLKSLPREDRKVVEELLAEKFGLKEEVKPKKDTSFRKNGYITDDQWGKVRLGCTCGNPAYIGCEFHGSSSNGSRFGVDFGQELGYETWVDSTSDLSFSGLRKLMYEFDKNNIRSDGRELLMGRNEFRRLMSDTMLGVHFVEGTQPVIMGMPVKIDYGGYGTMTIRGYR